MPDAVGEDLVVQPAARGEHAAAAPARPARAARSAASARRAASAGASRGRPSRPPAAPRRTAGCPPSARTGAPSRSPRGASPRMSVSCSRELLARERLQLDAAGARVALELGQQRAQRVAAVQLVRPVGGDHQHALAAQRAREVDEERARRAVGPVQVLDRQQQPVLAREQLQQLEQAVEQARLRGRLVVARAPPRARARGGSGRARRGRAAESAAKAGSPARASGRSAPTIGA